MKYLWAKRFPNLTEPRKFFDFFFHFFSFPGNETNLLLKNNKTTENRSGQEDKSKKAKKKMKAGVQQNQNDSQKQN